MRSGIRRPSPALAVSLAAMAIAIGGTAIVAQAGGGGSDTGKIVGYAAVKANGDVRGKRSLNINNSNVDLDSTSAFCFRNLPFKFKGGQATIDYAGITNGNTELVQFAKGDPYSSDCDASGVDAEVATALASGDFDPQPFYVVFYK